MWNNRCNSTAIRPKRIALALCMCFAVGFCHAQTDSEATETEQTQKAPINSESDQSPAQSDSGDFTPSEEISEDLSVSFPVDI